MLSPAAVLTGDLIGSTDAGTDVVEQAMQTLSDAARDIAGWQTLGDTRFTRFRGDGWQIIVADHALALRAALYLAARLRALHLPITTRIAIGIGTVDSVGTASLADARGNAFELSGRALDGMARIKQIDIAGEGITAKDQIIVNLLAARIRRWTREQAEAMAMALHPDNPTLDWIAKRLGISAQAVGYRQAGADGQTIKQALRLWEDGMEFPSANGVVT